MNRIDRLCCAALLALVFCGCDADFKPGYRIDSPRLLALAADHPYARPGETVALDLLVVGPGRASLEWAHGTCTLPADSSAVGCLSALDDGLTPFALDDGLPALQVPEGLLGDLPESQRLSALIGVAVVGCPGSLSEQGDTAGLPFTCRDESGRALGLSALQIGVKRVFVRAEDRNENPRIEGLRFDDGAWPADRIPRAEVCEAGGYDLDACPAGLRHRIRVEASAPERGVDEFGAAFEETIIIQYYATSGLFRDAVRLGASPDNVWVAQAGAGSEPPDAGPEGGGDALLWLLVRDDRGGVSWTRRQVTFR